jgi:hypothetical protein
MTLPRTLLTVREIGDRDHPYWLPASEDGGEPLLEPGEDVLWRGQGHVRLSGPLDHTLENVRLFITGRRIVWLTTEFDRGGGWVGFGVVGLTTAVVANHVSKRRAKGRRAGRVALGQIRLEWIDRVALRRVKPLLGGHPDSYIDLSLTTSEGRATVVLWGFRLATPELSSWIAAISATARLGLGAPGTTSEERADLASVAAGAQTHEALPADPLARLHWNLPGPCEPLIDAAYYAVTGPNELAAQFTD